MSSTPDSLDETNDLAVDLAEVVVEFDSPGRPHRRVLDGVSLQVQHGEFVALVGPSGCGKTTVMNLVVGLLKPSEGSVTVLATDALSARPEVGYMLARDALLPWRNALRNVEYGLELAGVDRATRRETARKMLAQVGLGESERLWPWQLSQGMRQRVALARTWALDPKLVLMDEPFASVDAMTRSKLQTQLLEMWARDRKTVLFITHDLDEALLLSDRVVLLGDGRICDDVHVDLRRPRNHVDLAASEEYQVLLRRLNTELERVSEE